MVGLPGFLQLRQLSLELTLDAATEAAAKAGVTRIADYSHVDAISLPLIQAVRPLGRSLSVTMGKGTSKRAAIVSALMEAIEIDAAERIKPTIWQSSIADLGGNARWVWCDGPRGARAIQLDPARLRDWIEGFDLRGKCPALLPVELVSLDYTRPATPDVFRTSVGLASGTTPAEALVGAVAELVEHHLAATWKSEALHYRRRCRIDPDSIDDRSVRAALARIAAAGREARLWSMSGAHNIAAFECVILDKAGSDTNLPPLRGTACHPSRATAALGAVLEAAQSRAAMIGGARDDLTVDHYHDGAGQSLCFELSLLGLPDGPLAWSAVVDAERDDADGHLAQLLAIAAKLSPLPVFAVRLPQPHPSLHVAKAICPGLESLIRQRRSARAGPFPAGRRAAGPRDANRIIFAGPSLDGLQIPLGVSVRPPAVAGDLASLLNDPPAAVALVDGSFETAPAVQHKELIDLLAAGVVVFGAASLGAIRAAELHMFGMIGVGAIFDAYRAGRVCRDDAVMLTHAPLELGYRALTIALVDIEAALATAELSAPERRMLQRIARTMPFRERTWSQLLATYQMRTGKRATFEPHNLLSQKREDTRAALALLAGDLPSSSPCPPPPLTVFYQDLLRRSRSRHE